MVGAHYLDQILFAVLPYLVFVMFLTVTIRRYRSRAFTYSSLSSQFLENRQHFWGLVPFHYGILVVLTGHVVAFLFPRELLAWNRIPVRLYILEVSVLIFALLTLVGLISAILPYLRSIVALNPQLGYISAMPFMAKLHIVNAYLLIGFFPYTRLVHILVVPNP